MSEIDYYSLIQTAGVKKGDIVDVTADVGNIILVCKKNQMEFEPQHFIDALCSFVGQDGTVMIRAFSWDFCHGKGFDCKTTRSQVGALGNIAMKDSKFKRTKHPIYNWFVWGKNSDYLCSFKNTDSWSDDSIFAWEEKMPNTVQLGIGDQKEPGLTFLHYIEEKVGVSYRYIKNFTDWYTGEDGIKEIRTYSMYVRDLNYRISISHDNIFSNFISNGYMKEESYSGIKTRIIYLNKISAMLEDDVRMNGKPSWVSVEPISIVEG